MEKDPTQPNFYEVSQERKSLRETLKESESLDVPEIITEKTKTELKAVQEEAGKFKLETTGNKVEIKKPDGTSEEVGVHNFSKAKELLREQKEEAEKSKWTDEVSILKEIGADYEVLSKSQEELSALFDFEMSQLRKAQFNPYARKSYENIREEILKEKIALAEKIKNIETKNPTAFRASELVSYNKGLHQEGHIAPVVSVKENLAKIGRKMISGKPMFLHGPTGTGKTSLARYAAKHFTGKDAEMVSCTPQTREANIWGKTGLRPAEGEAGRHGAIQTVDIYGPLAKAAKEGKTVIFDEFTALPKEQMSFIKGILNAKIGDSVNIVGNGKTEIASGFQMIFTANLKSEKNPERQEMPPEIAREFEQNNLKIEYNLLDEAYDIMLARLMNKDGSVDMSYYDLNKTLPKLCEAMAEIQIAYVNKESDDTARLTGTRDASGKTQGLKKLVMTQGTVENILNDWRTEKQIGTKLSFAEFLDTCLKTGLTFEEYPGKDRILAAKILASKGFLRTLSAKDLNLPQAVFDVDAIKKLRGEEAVAEIKEKSKNEKHISLKELAELDLFGKRRKNVAEIAGKFLPEEGKGTLTISEADEEKILENNSQFLTDTFIKWYNKTDAEKARQSVKIVSPKDIDWSSLKDDIDKDKFGEYTMNPDTAGIDWESIPPEKIKVFNFSEFIGKPRLELAKHLTENYSDKYHIPGIEYWKYLIENEDKIPEELKDGNYYYFFGSILRGQYGYWSVPFSGWDGSQWNRDAGWLESDWNSRNRVLLLEK